MRGIVRYLPAGAVALVACSLGLCDPSGADAPRLSTKGVRTVRDVAYHDGPDADPVRHKLDLYLPEGRDFPVLFFVHGGAWMKGDKNQFGVYGLLAKCFTRHGIALVCPNYRLSPAVQHPEHVRDVARAFAWTNQNIARFGGRPDEIFVGGHSAGGHLSALLATDETYLKEVGLSLRAVRGALPVSGVYRIPPDPVFDKVFTADREVQKQASPLAHVRPGLPPFLLLLADNELPACDRPGADAFCRGLQQHQCSAHLCEVPRRNHVSILLNATSETDPVTQAMLAFVASQVTFDRVAAQGDRGLDFLQTLLARYAEGPGKG